MTLISGLITHLFDVNSLLQSASSRNRLNTSQITATSLTSLAQIPDRSVVKLLIDEQPTSVEVVNLPASITLGLSGRSEIGQDGMLFVLPTRRIVSFWMKEMLFDLDFIWIDGDTIVSITPNVPAPKPGLSLSQLPSYSSSVPVTHVLEVPAEWSKQRGWKIGSKILVSQ